MSYTFRPAVRENTPLIIGIAGPTKSGKTFSAHRLAIGLAGGKPIMMINAEGARGHQYADTFKYLACDLTPPYRYGVYEDVLREAAKLKPGAIIIDSISHAHDGPGGFLEWHEEILDRIAGKDYDKRQRSTFTAWIEPKAAENAFRYALLEMTCPVILSMRAKEKLKISKGKVEELGWQPIVGEGIAFETLFTLMLPPRSKGVPDLSLSEMREPFDAIVPPSAQIDEKLGRALIAWSAGTTPNASAISGDLRAHLLAEIQATLKQYVPGGSEREKGARLAVLDGVFGVKGWGAVEKLSVEKLQAALAGTPSPFESACADAKAALSELILTGE